MKHIYHHSKKVLILALLMLFSISFYGQDAKTTFAPYWYLQGSVGTGVTHGDLSDNLTNNLGFLGGFGLGYQFSPVLGLTGKAQYLTFNGENEDSSQTFKNWGLDFSLNATVNLSNLFFGYKERTVSFVSHVGVGHNQYQSKLFDATGTPIARYGHNDIAGSVEGDGFGGRKVALTLPVGGGINIKASEAVDVNFDITTQWADTDLFDARGTGPDNDWFTNVSAGITYKLGLGGGLGKMLKNYELVKISATPEVLEEKGDMIDLEITGTIPEKYFSKRAAILMQPILVYDGGQTTLNTFTLKGEDVVGDGDLINYENGGTFNFKDTFKYIPEMNKSELIIVPLAYMARNGTMTKEDIMNTAKYLEFGDRKLADGVIYTSERIAKKLANIGAEHGYQKEVIVTKKVNRYFAKNLYKIDYDLKLNKCEHSQKAMEDLKDFMLRGWEIKSIDIAGWASPEGEETFNENLSENRAKATHKQGLKNLKKLLENFENLGFENVEDVKFNVTFHGQDWNGFAEMINKSDIADKNAIYNVINRAGSTLQKEQEVRNMITIYPEIEDEILPPLRRTEISVNAYEPKKTDEEILALATSDPKALDIYELLYAADMAKCADKLGIYKSIMDQYPKCWKSKNNAALILMKEGKLDKAEALLKDAHDMYPKVAMVINNLGVLYSYKGEYDKGEKYFLKAQDLGVNVDYNLGVVEIDKGDYEKALKLFGNKTCDYNVALAQILTGKYAKAENNLKCAEGCKGSIAYLMAVIGARTNNASMVYENLIKAIKVHDGFKKVAKDDREFLNFENTPDFKAIVE